MRVIGIVLILLGIMILSHFPMHKYLVSFDTENTGGYFRKTLGLYLDYFKSKSLPLISLGDLILKAETAVIVTLGDIVYEYQGWFYTISD